MQRTLPRNPNLPQLMKKPQKLICILAIAATLVGTPWPAMAANRTWNGGSNSDDLWGTKENWGGTAPTTAGTTGDTVIFSGTNRLNPNNTTISYVNGITFDETAGSFILKGNVFTLTGNIVSNSSLLQTIENGMTLNSTRTITANGDILIKGAIGESGGARALTKSGAGTLTLAGANTFTGGVTVNRGNLILDVAAGGSLGLGSSSTTFSFGGNSTTIDETQGGVFEVKGASTGVTTVNTGRSLYLNRSSGASRIVVDSNGGSGTTLQFSNLQRLSNSANGVPTLNVNLASPGSTLKLDAITFGMTNGVYTIITVTDAVKTGFATWDSGTGLVSRLAPTADLTGATGSSGTNYKTSGALPLTASVSANTVTITGAGAMTGSTRDLTTNAILMEENAGNYSMSINSVGNGGLIVHQYSTSGTLAIASNLRALSTNYTSNNFAKAGPGAVVFSGSAANLAGAVDIQGGLLRMDGSLGDTQLVQVRDGATLAGSGVIGGGTKWTYIAGTGNINSGTNYAPVNVWAGGTLDANHATANALSITGSLTLYAGSTFKMDLDGTAFDALKVVNVTPSDPIVTLDGDLKLTLGFAPTLGQTITLLTSEGGKIDTRSQFATINGNAATPTFSLDYLGTQYQFEITYGENAVWLMTAIPEPGTALFFAGGALLAAAWVRRRAA